MNVSIEAVEAVVEAELIPKGVSPPMIDRVYNLVLDALEETLSTCYIYTSPEQGTIARPRLGLAVYVRMMINLPTADRVVRFRI